MFIFICMCVQVMAELPVLLQGHHDANHRCHLHLNPNHQNPPQTSRLRTVKNTWTVDDDFVADLAAYGLIGFAERLNASFYRLR
jgi:hypothetical protein